MLNVYAWSLPYSFRVLRLMAEPLSTVPAATSDRVSGPSEPASSRTTRRSVTSSDAKLCRISWESVMGDRGCWLNVILKCVVFVTVGICCDIRWCWTIHGYWMTYCSYVCIIIPITRVYLFRMHIHLREKNDPIPMVEVPREVPPRTLSAGTDLVNPCKWKHHIELEMWSASADVTGFEWGLAKITGLICILSSRPCTLTMFWLQIRSNICICINDVTSISVKIQLI